VKGWRCEQTLLGVNKLKKNVCVWARVRERERDSGVGLPMRMAGPIWKVVRNFLLE